MKTIYWEIGEELRYSLEENNFDISKAIEVGSTNNSTIFNTTDSEGVIISQDYVSYNGELYNERISDNVKIYNGGFGIRYPKMDIFCKDVKMNNIDISTNDDNYFVIHNCLNKSAYEKLASKKMVVFFDYRLVKKNDNLTEDDSTHEFGYREYNKSTKLITKNGKKYYISVMIPCDRREKEKNGRTK